MQDQEKLIQQLKDALVAIKKLKAEVQYQKEKNNESIAIVGMAMRFPGNVNNADEYWNLLVNNIDAIEDIPTSRFDVSAFYEKEPALGKITLKQGGFLKGIDLFDASFFDLSRIETESIDPQQRLLLEVSYEALENSGVNVTDLVDSNTGVFMGITNVDYQKKHFRSSDYDLVNPYSYTGAAVGANAGRISYALGLQGLALALDTACSSSLVVTHIAAQALRNNDCNMAIVGAANIILEPELTMVFSNLNALSPDSRCKPFSNDANGFVRSEGCAVLILKRLSDAEKDNDNILAIIKGSVVNQDGRSNGFTAPSVTAQTKLLKTALQNAQLQPEDISYIEAHGTGTKIGDPIEMEAIANVFAAYKTNQSKLKIGSVKSNIGHAESVAGFASIIKTVLAFKHNTLPKSLHFNTPNELIDWNNLPVEVVQKNTPWNADNSFAGISSFGVTGTNAHIILGKYNNKINAEYKLPLRNDIYILPLSAKNEQALIDLVNKYIQYIKNSENSLNDICAMASLRRASYDYRIVFVAMSKEDLLEKLQDYSLQTTVITKIRFKKEDDVKTVFVFPGQGSQWISMGKSLIENEPDFKMTLEEINHLLKQQVNWDLFEEINKTESRFNEIDIVQPVLIAIQIALAKLWMSKGIQPDKVIGHSMGEVAAAYIAQKISLKDAVQIICVRSQLMKSLSGKGEMGATDLNIDEANEILKGYEDRLSVAVINSKNSIVLSGDADVLNQVFEKLEQQGKFNRKVKVDVASHSPQMDTILESLKNKLSDIESHQSDIQFYSTVKNKLVIENELNADYWCNNLRKPVQFGSAIQNALQDKNVVFIEMSPHPTLLHAINENIEESKCNAIAIASFVKDKNELHEFYSNYSQLHTLGFKLDFKHVYPDIGSFVVLPNYAWQKERYWFDSKPKNKIAVSTTLDVTKDDFYEIQWKEIQLENVIQKSKVLLLKDNYGIYKTLEQQLTDQLCTVVLMDLDDEITVSDIDVVIHTCSFYTALEFNLYLECSILSIQKILQYFSKQNKKPKICCVTNGAYALNHDKEINLNASLFAGALSSIQNEHTDFNFLNIDISNQINPDEISKVSTLTFSDSKFKTLAIRDHKIHSVFIQKLTEVVQSNISVNSSGTYLITGGTSGLGLEYAKWLSAKGARNIALVSRSGEHPETNIALDFILKNNCIAEVYKADISILTEVEQLIISIEKNQPKICGVFHAAAVLDDGLFLNLTKEQILKPILAKGIGAYNLHMVLHSHQLDCFNVCSSSANLLGSSAQANYNAANQMVDSLVAHRKNNGLPATSISWGNIDAIGLAAQDKIRGERLKEQGISLIYQNELFAFFNFIFSVNKSQFIPLRINFDKWSETNNVIKSNIFFSKVLQQNQSAIVEKSIFELNNLDAAIKQIKQTIKNNITAITKISTAKIKEDETFKSIGIDSLMALQLKNKLQTIYSISLNVSSIWAHPTVEKYANFISGELQLEEKYSHKTTEIVQEAKKEDNMEESIKNLSLEDLMKEINSKLE